MASKKPQHNSAFSEAGFKKTIEALKQEIVDLYLSDEIPWVVGYSGGKDSTAVLQLVWLALADLPEDEREHVEALGPEGDVDQRAADVALRGRSD